MTLSNALIDGDILTYRIGYSSEQSDVDIALWRLDNMVEGILTESGRDSYRLFLSSQDHSNFRYTVDPTYKSHRTVPKPKHYLALREHMLKAHKAEMVHGMEADDALGIAQDDRSIICSIDKDLDQIPGMHYNFVKHIKYHVTPEQGMRWFYKQMVLGDTADGVEGVKGVGPKKANKHFDNLTTEEEMYAEVHRLYKKAYGIEADTRLRKAGQLLKIKQSESEGLWLPPGERQKSTVDTGQV